MTAVRAKKHLGQHFLHDRFVINRIVDAIAPQRDDLLVEIGPGAGAITRPLLERVDHLHVIEIDRESIAHLQATIDPARITIHQHDVLDFDFAGLAHHADKRITLAGNLPYNISTPILIRVAEVADHITHAVFMLQREVVERMVAPPGSKVYGRLSVSLQYRFAMQKLFYVPNGAFTPPPKVESAMVRLTPLPAERLRAKDEKLLSHIVSLAFQQRRKTLANAVKAAMSAAQIEAAGVNPGARAETLAVADFVRLADAASC